MMIALFCVASEMLLLTMQVMTSMGPPAVLPLRRRLISATATDHTSVCNERC